MQITLHKLVVQSETTGEEIAYPTLVKGWRDIQLIANKGTDAIGRKILYLDVAIDGPEEGQQNILRYTPESLAELPLT